MAQAPADAPQPQSSPGGAQGGGRARAAVHGGFWTLAMGSVGVVFGDIGTSPIYALRESLKHVALGPGGLERHEVIGTVSLIFWALVLIVTIKYVFALMRLDNKGEGGTLALMALAQRALGKRTAFVFIIGLLGAALFYGDALITPAISVLSAVEGLQVVPGLEGRIDTFVLPISIAVLVGLFVVQSRGTGRVGAWFGPITVIWFLTIGGLGLWHIGDDPGILEALSPIPAFTFLLSHGFLAFIVLGSVFLAVTGAEALYADMGHFGRRPIQFVWVLLVLPCLTLNYLGQGALVLARPEALENIFFETAPDMMRLPLVILATMATIIASQAVITGAFSLTQQAIQLGFLPRMEIRRTSETQAGQIYMPQINWLVLVGVIILTLAFGSSSRLANAYGIAVTGEMVVTTLLAFVAIWKLWKQPKWVAALLCAPFLVIESVFLASNMTKVWSGGFVPLALALGLVILMWTWVRGTRLLTETTRRDEPLAKLFETLSHHPPHRVRGAAIFLTGDPDVAPAAMMHNLKHNQVLHEQIIILTVKTINAPRAPESERVKVEDFMPDVKRVILTFGFMETPNVVKALTEARKHGLKFDIMKTSFFLSRRTIVPSEKSGMPLWQDHLFIFLARNATNATDFFHIPSGRAVELGNQVMV
ncbi:potassium transporter Kup [Terricaulis silvestris]|uniref:Probable potassium transport system protein Kup n=1 Tax=Terricaulis silvestris TaxID=2686094 RepID=A0A6I6MVU0_9CAUL|nr:potassium transporter Kup [Terricaulis silvestris]QGZ96877.1 potassium transport protein Kup [Terricaulis silvestris]